MRKHSRRTVLLRLLAGGTVALLPFAVSRQLTPSAAQPPRTTHYGRRRRKLRPPGALKNDAAFVSACIGCGLCGEICPVSAIRFYSREGGDLANTPYIVAAERACVLCSKCMDVCPTEALTPTPREDIDMGLAQIDRSACYPWVDKGVCGACAVACPLGEKAMRFEFANMYRPIVQQGCVGCGVCVEVCPHPSLPIRIVTREEGTVARHSV